jgi:hypothetical protein
VAKGSHCQATMTMIEASGATAKKSKGCIPRPRARCANMPLLGFMNMFFQTSADTVGMTKKGAITITRTTPCPQNG